MILQWEMIYNDPWFNAFTMFYKLSLCFTSFHYALQAFTMFIAFIMFSFNYVFIN